MDFLDKIVSFLTSKTGIFAAIVALVGLIGGILKIFPIDGFCKRPVLSISQVRTLDAPPHSAAGTASFQLMNTKDGTAVMSDLLLIVTACGVTKTPKMVQPAAPVPQFSYKVTLSPRVRKYDVRKKEFGMPTPHSYKKEEIEDFVVELRSIVPQWYKFYFLIHWYDSKKPKRILELRSPELYIEFLPSIEDLLDG